MSTLSSEAILEIHDLTAEARRLATGTASERKQADALLARVATIRETGISTDEARAQYTDALVEKIGRDGREQRARHASLFRRYMLSPTPQHQQRIIAEARDMFAGSQSISYTEGSEGGMLVPIDFYSTITTAMAQVDPLLDPKCVDLIPEPTYAMNPRVLPGYDLSQIKAVRVQENQELPDDAFPYSSSEVLQGYGYKLHTLASYEITEDDFEPVMTTVGRAHGVGLARGIGADLVNGAGGGTGPSGLLTGASNSGYTTQSGGVITYTDIVSIYFSVNRVYRAAPKAAWVMNDNTLKLIRAATDTVGRPLISVQNDIEMLMGQPVLVSPSMPWGGGSKGIVFGDLSHFKVRVSALYLRKWWQVYADSARVLISSRMRADSTVFDPAIIGSPVDTSGAPIQYATIHN
ncbi:MAG TPA: phage major capsid protein [Candidatus Sulfotelmatobacter sp.]|nr:phage major capsid protein [Candidatus Sulfotelmatobacter sp.]